MVSNMVGIQDVAPRFYFLLCVYILGMIAFALFILGRLSCTPEAAYYLFFPIYRRLSLSSGCICILFFPPVSCLHIHFAGIMIHESSFLAS